jgi:hypothetical protein
MNKILTPTVDRIGKTLGATSRLQRRTGVLGGILLLALLQNPMAAFGALPNLSNATVAWDRSPSAAATGYRVYYGAASGNYTNSVTVGNVTTNTVAGLVNGVTYFFAVTALATSGEESTYSNEISLVPGSPSVLLRVATNGQAVLTVRGTSGHTYEIQASSTLTSWTVLGSVTLGLNGPVEFTDTNAASFSKRFYRTRDTQP